MISFFLASFTSFAQQKVNVHVTYTNSYCGGAKPTPEILEECNTFKDLKNFHILLGAKKQVKVKTDSTGSFTFFGLPAGETKVVASYSGFEEQSQLVTVAGTGTTTVGFGMSTSEVVTLEKFTVSSVKEGQALSITQQRNAANAKSVIALDEWGVLPTQNVGELFTRLPGVSVTIDEDNLINNITIRGMVSPNGQSFTRLNIEAPVARRRTSAETFRLAI